MTTPNAIVGRLIKVGGGLSRVLACEMLPSASGLGWTFVLLVARAAPFTAQDGELINITVDEEPCRLIEEPAPSVAPPSSCVLDETTLYRFPCVISSIETLGLKPDTADSIADSINWVASHARAWKEKTPGDLQIRVERQAKHITSIERHRKEIAHELEQTKAKLAEHLATWMARNDSIAAKDLALAELSRRAAAAETERDEATSELAALKLRGRECVTGCGETAVGNCDTCGRDECVAEVNAKTRELVTLRELVEADERKMVEQEAEIQQLNQRCYDLARQITTVTAVPTILPELFENSVERPDGRLCWECTDGSFVPVGDDGRASSALLAWGKRLVAERNHARGCALALQKRIDDFTRPFTGGAIVNPAPPGMQEQHAAGKRLADAMVAPGFAGYREHNPNAATCTAVVGCILPNGHSGFHEVDVTRWPGQKGNG